MGVGVENRPFSIPKPFGDGTRGIWEMSSCPPPSMLALGVMSSMNETDGTLVYSGRCRVAGACAGESVNVGGVLGPAFSAWSACRASEVGRLDIVCFGVGVTLKSG